MKKNLYLFSLLLIAALSSNHQSKANVSHEVGMAADLNYIAVAPNIYVVIYKYYRDCSAPVSPATTVPLIYRATGCHTGGTLNLNRNSITIGDPYCTPSACTPGGNINYHEITYSATITLAALCTDWVISVSNEGRLGDNLAANINSSLYNEATINNVAHQHTESPEFKSTPVIFAPQNRQVVFNQNASDFGGDSLSFALANPLNGHNLPAAFLAGYSASSPLGSTDPFNIDPITGMITFSTSAAVNTKFAARVIVTEHRKINGVVTIVGTVSRDLLIIVVPYVPSLPVQFTSNGQPLKAVYEIPILQTTCLNFTAVSPNAGSTVQLSSNAPMVLPRATFTVTGIDSVKTGTFCWRPTHRDIRNTPYRFNITVRNNVCPVPEFTTYTIEIRVVYRKVADPGPVVIADPNQPGVSKQIIPNIITPNNDGLNDAFIIPDLPENAELQLFDRKQKLVKTFKHYRNDWKGEGVKDGVYYFILKNKETGEVTKGEITVVR